MAVKCYISGENAEAVKVVRIIPKEGVGPGIRDAINRITSLEKKQSVVTGGCVFEHYVLGGEPPFHAASSFHPDIYHTANRSGIRWFGGDAFIQKKRKSPPLNQIWSRDYFTDEKHRCKIDFVTRYPLTLSVLQYLTGNENADHELELFKLFLTQNSVDMNGLERSFGFLEDVISRGVEKDNLMYMIKEMYPDLYHFVIDVMPFVCLEDERLFEDRVLAVSPDKAQNNARSLKLIRQLHSIANGSNNSK